MNHASVYGNAHVGNVEEVDCVVLATVNGFGDVLANLVFVHIEGGHDLDVPDVIAAEDGVHDARNVCIVRGIAIHVDALDEG